MRQGISTNFGLKRYANPFVFENDKGHTVKIIFLTSSIIRVVYSTKEAPIVNNLSTLENSYIKVLNRNNNIEIRTEKVLLVVALQPGFQLKWYMLGNKYSEVPFAEDLMHRSYVYDQSTDEKWHYRYHYEDTFYCGLGEHTGSLELNNRSFTMDRLDCMGYNAKIQDPLYKLCPFYVGLSRATKNAYGTYYNSFSKARMNFGQELDAIWGPYTYYTLENGPIDYYMIIGPEISSVFQSYLSIIGGPKHLPPRYSFGYLASSMGYAEATDAQKKIEEFARNCKKHQIPCDGIHLSSGYTVNEKGDRCVFTWNYSRFPDPTGLAKTLKSLGLNIFANVKPWLLKNSHPHYDQLEKNMGFVWNDDKPGEVMQWKGARNTMSTASYIDFTSKSGYKYWTSHLKSELLDKGFLLWLDNNEFTTYDDGHTYACEVSPYHVSGNNASICLTERTTAKKAGTALQTIMMIQASYEALENHNAIQRPFLITRSVTPFSNQLITQTWSGDNTTSWKTLKYNIPMGTGAALSGIPALYGHDIGGFHGPRPDPELLVRWVQQGIFWPRFCVHSWNTDNTITELWMYPEVLPTIRSCLQFRYKLIPFLYTLYVRYVYYVSEPLIRPVLYDHQYDIATYGQQFDFMLGPSLLVAPIYKPGTTQRQVYLPSGTAWYHYQTEKYFESEEGLWADVISTLEDEAAPLFVKAGSLICFGKTMMNIHESEDNERRVQVFPRHFKSNPLSQENYPRQTLVIYEDDGDTKYHEKGGAFAEICVWMEEKATEIHVGLEIVKDGFFPYYDTIWVTCPIKSETRKLVFEVPDEELDSTKRLSCSELPRFVDDINNLVYYGLKLPTIK